MATLTRSIMIDAPVEEVFDYALDIRNLWAIPDVGLADVTLTPDGVGSQARLFTHFLGFHMSMGLEYLEVVRPEKIVAKVTSFSPDRPMWTFTFEPAGSGTKLTVLGEWHIAVPAVGKPMEDMVAGSHKDLVQTMLTNAKAGAEKAVAA